MQGLGQLSQLALVPLPSPHLDRLYRVAVLDQGRLAAVDYAIKARFKSVLSLVPLFSCLWMYTVKLQYVVMISDSGGQIPFVYRGQWSHDRIGLIWGRQSLPWLTLEAHINDSLVLGLATALMDN